MNSFEDMKKIFMDPPSEFSPMPFWFWNDELTGEEIVRQIQDFHAKEVDGFVIHPRMGLPRSIPYMSDVYLNFVETAVAEADRLGMKVILYDEGMYPSGSACGMVVKQNEEYASRGIQMRSFPCQMGSAEEVTFPLSITAGEELISAQAVRLLSDQKIAPESTVLVEIEDGAVRFHPPEPGEWMVLLFIDSPSRGTIRGVHPGQDDGEPDAPRAADLLNPDAVQTFITLTHERYYSKLSRFFGHAIVAMFTDEPDLLGRGHAKGLKPWTRGFISEFLENGLLETDLPALWYEAGSETSRIRNTFETAIRNRLLRTYYKPLADWCEAHDVGLTGHPANSDDIGLLEPFHIPGQDVVWRYIAPEEGKALIGAHSTMGKCSSDAARHRRRRRNLNEVFGVCGIEGGWSLTADNMKWYLDWLFVRGVNLICPHAFYYSIQGERRDERPPDVGPHNIWWPDYALFSRYIKRMSWLMTDGINSAETAILAGANYLPWKAAKPLFESQIEFNYLEETLLLGACESLEGTLSIAGYRYKAVVIEDGERFAPESWAMLETFRDQGGVVIEIGPGGAATKDIGQIRLEHAQDIPETLISRLGCGHKLEPQSASIRVSTVVKDNLMFYVIVNEGEERYEGAFLTKQSGKMECWNPWTGMCEEAVAKRTSEGQHVQLTVERRECLILVIDPSHEGTDSCSLFAPLEQVMNLSSEWRIVFEDRREEGQMQALTSWTDWEGMARCSGSVIYEKSFELADLSQWAQAELDLGSVHEQAHLWVNGRSAGVRMWNPYTFDIGQFLQVGVNVLKVSVTNSLANQFDGKSFPSGMLGPILLRGTEMI